MQDSLSSIGKGGGGFLADPIHWLLTAQQVRSCRLNYYKTNQNTLFFIRQAAANPKIAIPKSTAQLSGVTIFPFAIPS